MDKEDVVHMYDGLLLSHKKEWNDAIYSDKDGLRNHTTLDRERTNIMWYHSYVGSNILNDTMNLFTKQEQTHR